MNGGVVVRRARSCGQAGHAVVEMALMAPWIFLLFLMVFDLGFYNYAVIATQNAARSGVMYTTREAGAALDLTTACQIALRELRGMPNVGPSNTTCAANVGAITNAMPVAVAVNRVDPGPDGWPMGTVSVTYRSPQLFPLPGLMGRMTVTRVAEARIRDN